jgi:predicted TIM-barrel fold metal-dependent hydrolase
MLAPCCPVFDGPTGQPMCSPDELLKWYDKLEIDKGCILPLVAPETPSMLSTQSNEESLRFCKTHPDRFVPFCNVDPRNCFNDRTTPFARILSHYKDMGCKGVGEVTANLPILDERVQALFAGAEEVGFSVTIHIAPFKGENYGVIDLPGLPGLEDTLKRFPNLKIFGHSQAFWCEIGKYQGQGVRFEYPTGPVKEGRIAELMRKYPNLYGDLSASSGANALIRDKAYAIKFLNEFQDRLMFGMDIVRPYEARSKLPFFLKELLSDGLIAKTVFDKIANGNAKRLLCL